MTKFLVINPTQNSTEFAIFCDDKILQKHSESKTKLSKDFFIILENLFAKTNLNFENLDFIAVNQGPGPFTTLRVVLASVNGLSFASKIPLVGIDGIKTLLEEFKDSNFATNIALLNAFADDVYFAIDSNNSVDAGYENIDTFLNELKNKFSNPINFFGAGTELFAEKIKNILGDQAVFAKNVAMNCSIERLVEKALEKFTANQTSNQLLPLYLKIGKYKPLVD
ncbi:MAG: Universal bacterial protein YeaZ [candidate division TM6 bacterium GW2011_GWF2_32_72]|nr:MAG: Universal bacterial protein YeaZ [candidate division TM6 bacterium GW2011_GWF2_32_72]